MSFSLEEEVVFAALSLDKAAEVRLRHALQPGLNWLVVESLAIEHNVLALLYQCLKQVATDCIPSEGLNRLKEIAFTHGLRSQRLAELTLEILDLLHGSGVQAIPFKGPALAVQAYGDLALRQYSDIDLLVQEKDFRRAHDLIVSMDFMPEMHILPAQDHWLLRAGYDLRFNRQKDILELHWAITERSNAYPLKNAHLWEHLLEIPILGRPVAMFSAENTALMLCIHGSKHQWQKLKWIADLAYLVHRQTDFDWEELLGRARALGFQRMVGIGLTLSERVLGLPLPSEVRVRTAADPWVERLTNQVLERTLLKRQNMETVANNWFYLQVRERLRDRLYYIYDQALVPKQADWLDSKLPPRLYAVYYPARPIRLAIKFGRQFIESRRRLKASTPGE